MKEFAYWFAFHAQFGESHDIQVAELRDILQRTMPDLYEVCRKEEAGWEWPASLVVKD